MNSCLGLRMHTRYVPKTGMVDVLYIFKVRSDSIMFVPDSTNFYGKTLQEASVSICIQTLSLAISIVAKIPFSGEEGPLYLLVKLSHVEIFGLFTRHG